LVEIPKPELCVCVWIYMIVPEAAGGALIAALVTGRDADAALEEERHHHDPLHGAALVLDARVAAIDLALGNRKKKKTIKIWRCSKRQKEQNSVLL